MPYRYVGTLPRHRAFCDDRELSPPEGQHFMWGDESASTRLLAVVMAVDLCGNEDHTMVEILLLMLRAKPSTLPFTMQVEGFRRFLEALDPTLYRRYEHCLVP